MVTEQNHRNYMPALGACLFYPFSWLNNFGFLQQILEEANIEWDHFLIYLPFQYLNLMFLSETAPVEEYRVKLSLPISYRLLWGLPAIFNNFFKDCFSYLNNIDPSFILISLKILKDEHSLKL